MNESGFDELENILGLTEAEAGQKKAKPGQTGAEGHHLPKPVEEVHPKAQEKPPEESPPKPSPAPKAVPEPTSESVPTQEEPRTPPNGDASPPGTQFPSGERSPQEGDIPAAEEKPESVGVPSITDVQNVIEEAFPDYWPAVEAGIATIATLLLEKNSNPATLFYFGEPSTGKTTVIDMFSGHPVTYLSDNFTPASFVSHKADKSGEGLAKIDLLPRIKHKTFLTPEMAPTFSGKGDKLQERLSVMTRVLDGRGLMTDSGTHGRRGYEGDYLFSWIGATVPIQTKVWEIMGNMGSRLLFWPMPETRLTTQELVDSLESTPYKDRLDTCKRAVHAFLNGLLKAPIRSVSWDARSDPKEVKFWIARFAELLVALRSKEKPFRAQAMLTNFAQGHALIHGRRQLTEEDLDLTAQLAVGSIPERKRQVLTALIQAGGIISVPAAQKALGVPYNTAEKMLKSCSGPVMRFIKKKPAHLRLRDEWVWCNALHPLEGPLTVESLEMAEAGCPRSECV